MYLFILFRLINNTDVGLTAFGIKNEYSFLTSFISGIFTYFIFSFLYSSLLKMTKYSPIIKTNNYLVNRDLIPRKKSAKLYFIISACLLNPFIEETVYRGILVYYIGNIFFGYWLALIVGLIFCLAIHIYQDIYNMAFHSLFYFASIALLFSPLGLAASFGLHFAGDIYPTYNIRKSIKTFRKENKLKLVKNVANPRLKATAISLLAFWGFGVCRSVLSFLFNVVVL